MVEIRPFSVLIFPHPEDRPFVLFIFIQNIHPFKTWGQPHYSSDANSITKHRSKLGWPQGPMMIKDEKNNYQATALQLTWQLEQLQYICLPWC